ncbi:DNA-3-methyladenine glycosylase [Philodulcilactobacillus myokoensis]|uniref:DNA-3-methyladenine glycosylase n=1 Tax=Philodulcilactobacillus myokoensis TaxID=2929573 RepID=A0A9W6B1B3_9LACO|nr:DNA-3-methyladenine glycosylase I [Philodulcilactobacillus myokoensis]GLB47065.1 DNA-3-methyladenine glycosylase [Philodulcilactobacillus myokoensis]
MLIRCPWATKSNLLIDYHDSEWGVPKTNERELFECLSLEMFQAGLTWNLILKKRPAFKNVFDQFKIEQVSQFNQNDYSRLMSDASIIRNRAKIIATIHNAKMLQKMHQNGMTLSKLTWQPVNFKPIDHHLKPGQEPNANELIKKYVKLFKKQGFKRVGPKTLYSYLQSIGVVNDHLITCFRHNQIKKEYD